MRGTMNESLNDFASGCEMARMLNMSYPKFFNLVHSGAITIDGKLSSGQLLFRKSRLPEISARLHLAQRDEPCAAIA
jgi:hypothetical protein